MNRIDRMFKEKRERSEGAVIFYVTAGYPDMLTTEKVIGWLAEEGADLIELGVPFSDPLADGPTIQYSSQVALERGATVDDIISLAGRVRMKHPELPIIFFTAYNPVFHRGDERFAREIAKAGADGLLVPDLPPEEAGELRELAGNVGLAMVFLVAPTTAPARAAKIAEASSGFIYYISLKGVTGARASLPPDLQEKVRQLKAITDKPVAVGFGVSGGEQVRAIAEFTDGVVIGSALIKTIGDDPNAPGLEERVREFAREIVRGARRNAARAIRGSDCEVRNAE